MCLNSKKGVKGGGNKAFYNTDTRMTKNIHEIELRVERSVALGVILMQVV